MSAPTEHRRTAGNEPQDWTPGTAGDDVMTVHKVRDGKPLCGAKGAVDEWQRAVTCRFCLLADRLPVPAADRAPADRAGD